jgi:hypothetical protein
MAGDAAAQMTSKTAKRNLKEPRDAGERILMSDLGRLAFDFAARTDLWDA